jgi:hypothetical protein
MLPLSNCACRLACPIDAIESLFASPLYPALHHRQTDAKRTPHFAHPNACTNLLDHPSAPLFSAFTGFAAALFLLAR